MELRRQASLQSVRADSARRARLALLWADGHFRAKVRAKLDLPAR